LSTQSVALSIQDAVASLRNQGGFLDFAATGTVTYTAVVQGGLQQVTVPVTPDPSTDPTITTAGLLDVLADSEFNVQRIPATAATGTVNLVNSSPSNYGPFSAGTFHVANPTSKQTYSNQSTLTISASGTTPAIFAADVAGSAGTSGTGTITQLVTSLLGVTASNPSPLIGANAESNTALVARCRAKQQALSPNGPKGAYQFVATSASQLLAAQTPPETLRNGPITKVLVQTNTATGAVTVYIANAAGATDGVAGLLVTGATGNGVSPIILTVGSTTGILATDPIYVAGVQGNTAANGWHTVASLDPTHLTLEASSVGNGAYTSGGVVEAGDLGMVDNLIQSMAVPESITEITLWAPPQNISLITTVFVPVANSGTAMAAVSTALANYLASVPIGGFVTGVPTPNTIPYSAVLGAIQNAATYIRDATLTLNGTTLDVPMGSTSVPFFNPITINVSVF